MVKRKKRRSDEMFDNMVKNVASADWKTSAITTESAIRGGLKAIKKRRDLEDSWGI